MRQDSSLFCVINVAPIGFRVTFFLHMTPTPETTPSGFSELGIEKSLLAILTHFKYTTPTPIQHKAIPTAITGADVVGIAQTGTGKTLAFGIPMIQRLGLHKGRGLVILPTRELALQVNETFEKIAKNLGLRTSVLIGGENINRQLKSLQLNPHVIIATPGRLVDHMRQSNIKLDNIKILVLDEADRMFDMGFLPQLNEILRAIPKDRQTMMFSATMPKAIMDIASTHMKLPVRIEVAPQGTSAERVEQEICMVNRDEKLKLLKKILSEYAGTVLIFSRTKHGAKRITLGVQQFGHTAAEIHSNKSLSQRIKALDGFKTGKFRVLVATDIAARGIDVNNIELVINYDLPDQIEDYVHRIGRTGRAGKTGRAISFATPDQKYEIRKIEELIRKPIAIRDLPEFGVYRPGAQVDPLGVRARPPMRGNSNRGEKRPYVSTPRRSDGSRDSARERHSDRTPMRQKTEQSRPAQKTENRTANGQTKRRFESSPDRQTGNPNKRRFAARRPR
jgi:ATP-dependent RNA helicase RhlE